MAIPNNYIDKITDHDSGESRPICPPAEHVSVDNENYEGETLDEVLDEVAQAIEEAGQGGYAPPAGGIPKTDLAQSVQDSLDKADSALQDEDVAEVAKTGDYDDLQNKPTIPDTSNLATKTELATKQDALVAGNGIVIANDGKTVSVAEAIRTGAAAGATAYQKPSGGIPASDIASGVIPTLPQNIVQSITINGTPHTPTNGVVDLGNVAGEKGDKGDKGDTVVLDPSQVEQFDIINSLNAQAAGNALDAYQGARLKAQIDYVYARLQAVYTALGNIAFWDGKPASATILPNLDWGLPKHTLTLNLTLSNASVKVNGTAYTNGDTISVEEYATLSVLIEAASGHTFASAPTLTFGGTSVTLTPNQDGSYSADVVMGQSDAAMAVSASAVVMYSISYSLSNCSAPSGVTNPTSVLQGGTSTIRLTAQSGYALPSSLPSGAVVGASVSSWDSSTGTLVISNVTGNVTIAVTAGMIQQVNVTMKKVTGYGAQYDTEGNYVPEKDDFNYNTIYTDGAYMTLGDLSSSTPECSLSNVNYIYGSPFSAFVIPSAGYGIFSVKVEQNGQDITDNAYTPANRSINVVSANSTLAITVIVCAATNSFFMGGSFFGVQGGIQTLFEPQKSGQIVTDPDWQCMSEFVPVPAGATHVRWWLGDNTHKPYDETQTGPVTCQQRSLIFYDKDFVPGRSGTYYSVDKPYRDYNMSTFTFTPKYVRASFKTSLIQYARIQFSSDGTNFTDAWVYSSNN